MKLCLKCFNILVDDYHDKWCPLRECEGEVISADENIVPALIELNKKGYYTNFSCSGHPTRAYLDCYVSFDEGINLESSPEGFELQKLQDENMAIHNVIRKDIWDEEWAVISTEDRLKIVADINISILKWAKSLKSIKEDTE
jgi:hypothetical protein